MHKTSSVELRKIVRLVRSVILYQPRTGTSSCQFRNGTTVWTRSTRQFTMQHLLFKVNTAHASLVAFLKKHLGRKQQVKSWRINHNGFSPDSYPGADGIRTVRNLHDPVEGSYQLRDASSLTNWQQRHGAQDVPQYVTLNLGFRCFGPHYPRCLLCCRHDTGCWSTLRSRIRWSTILVSSWIRTDQCGGRSLWIQWLRCQFSIRTSTRR